MVAERDAKIVFHPNGVANRMMRPRREHYVRWRVWPEKAFAVVRHYPVPPGKVAAFGKQHHLPIQTFRKKGFTSAGGTPPPQAHFLLHLRHQRREILSVDQQAGRGPFEIEAGAKLSQEIDAQDAINAAAAGPADGREIDGRKAQVPEVLLADSQITNRDFLRLG